MPAVLPDKSVTQQKLANYLQQVLSLNNLRPLIERERLARPGDFEKVYWETHKNLKLEVGGDAEPEVDLVYTDSTPQRAKGFCELWTSAFEERTRIDSEAAFNHNFNVSRGPVAYLGGPPFYQVRVVLPCAYAALDLSHLLVCAALGSATGLLIGTAMIVARRKSLGKFAKPRG